jgi:predicted ATPase
MKITIKNLGVLKNVEYELGNLTIVCGKNNTGKTYAAYALFGFLNYWRNNHEFTPRLIKDFQNGEILINQEQIREYLPENLKLACKKYCQEQLPTTLGYSSESAKQFENCEFNVEIDFSKTPLFERNAILHWKNNSENEFHGGAYIIITDESGENIRIDQKSLQTAQKCSFDFTKFLPQFISKSIIPCASFASADRIGAAMFSDEIRFLRDEFYQKQENFLNKKISLTYPLAVSKNLNAIRDSLLFPPQLPEDIQQVFEELLGGTFEISNRNLFFILSRSDKLPLAMSASSSSVRSLLSLLLQLCNQTQNSGKPNMFMIDEPELNLHPENQRLLARIFARLVNLGYKIYITTHSDYILKELNTLILLNRRNKNTDYIIEQYGYSEKEFLDPANVRAYIAQESETKNPMEEKNNNQNTIPATNANCTFVPALIDNFGMEISSFDKSIDEMNRIQNEILAGDDDE